MRAHPLPGRHVMAYSNDFEMRMDAIAYRVGVPALRRIIPFSRDQVKQALADGDEHLNSLPLAAWDRAAGAISVGYGGTLAGNFRFSWDHPWEPWKASGLSLSERVCVLKHVAIHYYANEEKSNG